MRYLLPLLALYALGLGPEVVAAAEDRATLCATYDGPAFLGLVESLNIVVVHAGPYQGISFLSLDTGQIETQIPISQRFLAASVSTNSRLVTLATADTSGIRIRNFDVASRQEGVSAFFSKRTADLGAFTPDGKSFLAVTVRGDVLKIDIDTNKLEVLEGAAVAAHSIAISAKSDRLYVAGKGITIIDIQHFKTLSTLNPETRYSGIAVSPNGDTVAVRSWHDLELLNPITGSKAAESITVDATPSAISASLVKIAFSPDQSHLFYTTGSYKDSELISFSLPALRIEKRLNLGPLPSAMSIAPIRQWVIFVTGNPGFEQLEAFDLQSLVTKFRAQLTGGVTGSASERRNGCARRN
jgi:WD40 repeat protein